MTFIVVIFTSNSSNLLLESFMMAFTVVIIEKYMINLLCII